MLFYYKKTVKMRATVQKKNAKYCNSVHHQRMKRGNFFSFLVRIDQIENMLFLIKKRGKMYFLFFFCSFFFILKEEGEKQAVVVRSEYIGKLLF